MYLDNNQGNLQLHRFTRRENTAKSFGGGLLFWLTLYTHRCRLVLVRLTGDTHLTIPWTATAIWHPSEAHCTTNQTMHHRWPGIWRCSFAHVEQSAARCHFRQLTAVHFLSFSFILIMYRVLEAFSLNATLISTFNNLNVIIPVVWVWPARWIWTAMERDTSRVYDVITIDYCTVVPVMR